MKNTPPSRPAAPAPQKPANKANNKNSSKAWNKFVEGMKSPIAVGLFLTAIFTFVGYNYYQVRGFQESQRRELPKFSQSLFQLVERADLLNQDGRFRMRGEIAPSSQVGLLTIDDRSIEEIGRWPWSREKIAFVVEEMRKYGAKAIGFDIVFSEPKWI